MGVCYTFQRIRLVAEGRLMMDEKFDEYSDKAQEIMGRFEAYLGALRRVYNLSYKDPTHDMARRFLNEIEEFEALDPEATIQED